LQDGVNERYHLLSDDNFTITLEGPEERMGEVKKILLDREPGAKKESRSSEKANVLSAIHRLLSSTKGKQAKDQGLRGNYPYQGSPGSQGLRRTR